MIIIFILLGMLLLTNIIIYYNIIKLIKYKNKNQAKKICAWIEGVCDLENIENFVDDKNNTIKFWGIVISNNSNSIIYDVKITIEEIQNDRIINIHRNINLLPPGRFYCKRLYSPSKLPFDLPKRFTNFNELVNLYDKIENKKSLRPLTNNKKKIIKLEFRDSNKNLWEKNDLGNLKLIK